jgi:uncharacterized membrane protein (DUF373 family)
MKQHYKSCPHQKYVIMPFWHHPSIYIHAHTHFIIIIIIIIIIIVIIIIIIISIYFKVGSYYPPTAFSVVQDFFVCLVGNS